MEFPQYHEYFSKVGYFSNCKRQLKFCQIGEISPNLVTLLEV